MDFFKNKETPQALSKYICNSDYFNYFPNEYSRLVFWSLELKTSTCAD